MGERRTDVQVRQKFIGKKGRTLVEVGPDLLKAMDYASPPL